MASCLQIESVGRTCWMRQQDLDAPRIPVPHLFGAMQDPRLGKSLLQHIEVMLVGIEYEDGLPRIRLDDVRQGVKLGMMQGHDLMLVIVDAPICHLQQLIAESRRAHRRDLRILHLQDQVAVHPVIVLARLGRHPDADDIVDALRQGDVILSLEAHTRIPQGVIDTPLTARIPQLVAVDDVAVAPIGHEPAIAVHRHALAEALASVQQVDLAPEVHQRIRCWRARQDDAATEKWQHLAQRLEALGLRIFEARRFIDDQHVKGWVIEIVFHEPDDILAVRHIAVRIGHQGPLALGL